MNALDCIDTSGDPGTSADLRRRILDHQLRCGCGLREERLDFGRASDVQNLLRRISYRDWSLSLQETPNGASHTLTVTSSPQEGLAGTFAASASVCPRMTDDYLVDLLFEMVKCVETSLAEQRLTLTD